MRVLNIIPLASVAITVLVVSGVNSANANAISAEEFVRKASISNQFEIESSKLAKGLAQKEEVKRFADKMVADHTSTASELKSAALAANVDPNTVSKGLDNKHMKKLEDLKEESEEEF